LLTIDLVAFLAFGADSLAALKNKPNRFIRQVIGSKFLTGLSFLPLFLSRLCADRKGILNVARSVSKFKGSDGAKYGSQMRR
jgi:hypothetical protein